MLRLSSILPPKYDPQVARPSTSSSNVLRLDLIYPRIMLKDFCECNALVGQLDSICGREAFTNLKCRQFKALCL